MAEPPTGLNTLLDGDADVTMILDYFSEIERVYLEALEAMGAARAPSPEARNSAEVTVLFRQSPASSAE